MASGEIDVTPGRILDGTELVTHQKLNDLAVPTLRIKELTITAREIADGTINSDKLDVDLEAQLGVPDNSVTTNKLVDDSVTTNKIAENQTLKCPSIRPENGTTPVYRPSGLLDASGTAMATVGSSILTARTLAIPANLLSTNGDMLRFMHVIHWGSTANAKNLWFQWNAVNFYQNTANTSNNIWSRFEICMIRTGANSQKFQIEAVSETATPAVDITTASGTANLAVAQTYYVIIQGVASNDVTDEWFMAEYLPFP